MSCFHCDPYTKIPIWMICSDCSKILDIKPQTYEYRTSFSSLKTTKFIYCKENIRNMFWSRLSGNNLNRVMDLVYINNVQGRKYKVFSNDHDILKRLYNKLFLNLPKDLAEMIFSYTHLSYAQDCYIQMCKNKG